MSLWGGNFEDDGLPGSDSKQFWGNYIGGDASESLRSETQKLLSSIPATSGNLLRVQDAIIRDLNPLIESEIVTKLSVEISLVDVKKISIVIDLTVNNENYDFEFTREWTGAR